MIGADILQPVVALLAWTMVMWAWMYATRLPAMSRAGVEPAARSSNKNSGRAAPSLRPQLG